MKEIKDLKRHEVLESDIGVYFLYKGDEIVYVGQSICVWRRINTHIQEGVKDFDSYSVMPCSEDDLEDTELFYIHTLQPKYNKQLDGFCNTETFIKKVQRSFEKKPSKKLVKDAIKESGVKVHSFKGVDYMKSSDYVLVSNLIMFNSFLENMKKADQI